MHIVFCVYAYTEDVLRLQPWLTIHQVALGLIKFGWKVSVLTDQSGAEKIGGIDIHYVDTLRSTNTGAVYKKLISMNPDCCVVLTTPLNLASSGWYKYYRGNLVAFLSYPFYTKREYLRALPHLNVQDIRTYYKHMLVPSIIWKRNLRLYFKAVTAQSSSTANHVADIVGSDFKRYSIPAGIDLDAWRPSEERTDLKDGCTRYIYMGWAKAIRGYEVMLRAYRNVANSNTELRILARGASDEEVLSITNDLKNAGLDANVNVIGGWMSIDELRKEISNASVALLPFILVPSELPVSVIECIACGTPVIGTNIDGLPEAIGDAGIVVTSGSVSSLSKAMAAVQNDQVKLKQMNDACQEARKSMLSWEQVSHKWAEIFKN